MIRTVLLGYGNVGQHLYNVMEASKNLSVVQVYNRTTIQSLPTPQTQDISKLAMADVYIIAVPDDAINEFSESLPFRDRLVVHTSGGANLNTLSGNNRRGVLYPLQTFSKNTAVDFNMIPICVEAEQKSDLKILKKIGSSISEKVVEITSKEREQLHVAAVFVNNFTNHLYHIAETITAKQQVDFSLLKPLIAETARKIRTSSPADVQTGPAKRNDKKTIEKHLKLLEQSNYRDIYKQITESIQKV